MASEKRVVRYSLAARVAHWSVLVSVVLMLYTGIAIYAPGLNFLAKWIGGFFVAKNLHRVGALIFVIVPLALLPFTWQGSINWLKELFSWQKGDAGWLARFPLYLFRPSLKMPPLQSKISPAQRLIAIIMLAAIFSQAVTGILMGVLGPLIDKYTIIWATLFHDVGMVVILVCLILHAYIGLGGFKPFRGVWRGMLGGGAVDYKRAKHLWPKWTEEAPKTEK